MSTSRKTPGGGTPAGGRARPPAAHLVERALALGAKEAKLVDASSIATAAWVRMKCRYGCGCYGSSLCCPPHSPTPGETRELIDSYDRAVLFEGGTRGPKKIAVDLEREAFLAGYYEAFGMGCGPCGLCDECALDEGCRHPREARPAMEACGIDVFGTARKNGFVIEVARDRDDEARYFGVVLLE